MAVRKQHVKQSGYYFITFTCYKWLHLFQETDSYDLVYKWFRYLDNNGQRIVGYVIMPNHLHLLMAYKENEKSLNTIIGNGKRFLAYGIVARLKEAGKVHLLGTLAGGVISSDEARGKKHEVFEESFEVKQCKTNKFLVQKLEYIHNNPLSNRWLLVTDRAIYRHSSASYYDTGVQSMHSVSSWLELEAMGWWEQAVVQ